MQVTRNTKKARLFEDLRVWQESRKLTKLVYKNSDSWKDWGLRDQIRRASVSVVSNIAEGYERGSKEEFVRFLFISRGSCGEVRTQLYVAYDLGLLTKNDFESMFEQSDYVIRMLAKLISTTKERKYVRRVSV